MPSCGTNHSGFKRLTRRSKMWTCRLQVSLLVVCLPFVFCAPAKAQYLNEPYVVANVGGPLWWSDAAYNPARNEYCMTWENGYVIQHEVDFDAIDSNNMLISFVVSAESITYGNSSYDGLWPMS